MALFRKSHKLRFRTVKSGNAVRRIRILFLPPKPMSLAALKLHCKARIDFYSACRPHQPYWWKPFLYSLVLKANTKTALRKRLQLEDPVMFPDSAFVGF